MKFWQDHASYPFKSHDAWFVTEDIRWGKFEPTTDIKALVDKVNREDLWREAAKSRSASRPPTSRHRRRAARRPSSTARCSIPANPRAYLKSLVDQARRSLMRIGAAHARPRPHRGDD